MSSSVDPLDSLLSPPPNEPPPVKLLREEKERVAKSISDAIDEALRQERAVSISPRLLHRRPSHIHSQSDKRRRSVKLLLLGQSESGQSRHRFPSLHLNPELIACQGNRPPCVVSMRDVPLAILILYI